MLQTIIDYDYAAHKDQYRMQLNERASIFLPFAALAGFEEEINKDQSNTTWLGNAATIKNIQKRDGRSPLSAYSYCVPQRILGHQPLSRQNV